MHLLSFHHSIKGPKVLISKAQFEHDFSIPTYMLHNLCSVAGYDCMYAVCSPIKFLLNEHIKGNFQKGGQTFIAF